MALTTRVNTPLQEVLAINKAITRELALQQSLLQRNQNLRRRGSGNGRGPGRPGTGTGSPGYGPSRSGGSYAEGERRRAGSSKAENLATGATAGALGAKVADGLAKNLASGAKKGTIRNLTFPQAIQLSKEAKKRPEPLPELYPSRITRETLAYRKNLDKAIRDRIYRMGGRGEGSLKGDTIIRDPGRRGSTTTYEEAYREFKKLSLMEQTRRRVGRGNRYINKSFRELSQYRMGIGFTKGFQLDRDEFDQEKSLAMDYFRRKEAKARASARMLRGLVASRLTYRGRGELSLEGPGIKKEIIEKVDARIGDLLAGKIKSRYAGAVLARNKLKLARAGIEVTGIGDAVSAVMHPIMSAKAIFKSVSTASRLGLPLSKLAPGLSKLSSMLGFATSPALGAAAGFGMGLKILSETLKVSNEAVKSNEKSNAMASNALKGSIAREYRAYKSSVSRSGPSSGWGVLLTHDTYSSHVGRVAEQTRIGNLDRLAFQQSRSGGTGSMAAGIWDSITWAQGKPFAERMGRMHKLKDRFVNSATAVLGDNSLGVDALNDAYGGRISTGRMVLNKANGEGSVKDIMPQAAANINFMLGSSQTTPEIVNAVNMASSTLQFIKKREEEQRMWDSLPENYEPIRIKKHLAMARETLDIARIQQWNRQ